MAPTIVLISGAFHVDSVMHILSGELQRRGYNTRTQDLISVNNRTVSVERDTQALRENILIPLVIEQRKDIVVFCHSYAGFPSSGAIGGLSKAERLSKGLPGGIIGLIYLTAFIPPAGKTLLQMIGGDFAPWQEVNKEAGLVFVRDPINTFYADVPKTLASEAVRQLYGQSLLSFRSPSGPTFYQDEAYNGRRVYIHTSQDQALPTFLQDEMVNKFGVGWEVERMEASHSPLLSQPEVLTGIVLRRVELFEASFHGQEMLKENVSDE